uniref:IreB family regulatory phosphoprotein n=1 Tax=Bacillus pumilus TaxID=1408 RepID=UPI00119D6245
FHKTINFNFSHHSPETNLNQLLITLHHPLQQKPYNPINQILQYFLSPHPPYIPTHHHPPNLIPKLQPHQLIHQFLKSYL